MIIYHAATFYLPPSNRRPVLHSAPLLEQTGRWRGTEYYRQPPVADVAATWRRFAEIIAPDDLGNVERMVADDPGGRRQPRLAARLDRHNDTDGDRLRLMDAICWHAYIAISTEREIAVSETVDALLCDLLAWLARDARSYDELMEAWRTSCPRLPVWEDANELGFVEQTRADGHAMVRITPAGREFLARGR
jgi:hypothetical protein